MECAECTVRSSVGYCHECDMLLCEVCSHTCERCGKVVCSSHIQRTSSGRNICVSCVVQHYDKRARQSKERREQRAEQVEMGRKVRKPHKRKTENLSFEALAQDQPAPLAGAGLSDAVPGAYHESPLADPDQLNARVLTGSASRRTPVWLSGLLMGAAGWILFLLAMRDSAVDIQRAILNLLALLASLGAVLWTGQSAFSKTPDPGRGRSRIALAVGLGALLVSGGLYVLRGMGIH